MVDNPPQTSSQSLQGGVAALAPQFDLAVTASSRRSAPPIGSLSPQGTPYGPFPPKPSSVSNSHPQRSPSLAAADFLQQAALHTAEYLPTRETHPSQQPSQSQQPPSSPPSHSSHQFDFGFASLDLGPPVFEPPISPHLSQQSQQQPQHQHLQPGQPPPSLLNPHLSTSSSSPLPSPTLPSLHAPTSPVRTPSREQQHPTRCVLLRNIPPGIDDDDIRNLLQVHGPLRDLGAQQRSRGGRGSVLATYYDLRHARAAVRALHSSAHFGRRLEAKFQCPSDHLAGANTNISAASVPPCTSLPSPFANQGTLVVFNLDNSTSAEDIRTLFSTMGDVKEIRATPNKKHHKFVEFYDVRDAERAMKTLNKTDVNGKRIKIEISRPGGRAASLTRHMNGAAPIPKHHHHHHSHHRSVHQPIHQPSSQVQFPPESGTTFLDACTAHQPLNMSAQDMYSSPHIPTSLLNSINHALPPPQLSPFATSSDVDPLYDPRSPPLSGDISTLVGSTGFDACTTPQYPRPASFDSAFLNCMGNDDVVDDYAVLHTSYDPLGDAQVSPTPVDHCASDLHRLYSSHVTELNNKYSSNPTLLQRSTPRYTTDSYIQALYNSPSSDDSRKPVSPTEGSPTASSSFAIAKHDPYNADAAGINLYKNSFSDDLAVGSIGNTNNNAHTINLNSDCNFSNHTNHAGRSNPLRKIGGASQAVMVPIAGDRTYPKQGSAKGNAPYSALASSKQCFNHPQQLGNSKYALDIRRVRLGEETRTALMIRNIPNKYNQKMLLSTLEEGHRGHFDFIYLPIDFKNKCNVGYAFINFTRPEYIEPFYNGFHGKKWGRFNSEKVCEITFARIQGRQQLIAHFQNSSLLLEDPKCRPVIFDAKGRQEEFPIGSHVRTRRGPSSRDTSHRVSDVSPPYSPTKQRGRS